MFFERKFCTFSQHLSYDIISISNKTRYTFYFNVYETVGMPSASDGHDFEISKVPTTDLYVRHSRVLKIGLVSMKFYISLSLKKPMISSER